MCVCMWGGRGRGERWEEKDREERGGEVYGRRDGEMNGTFLGSSVCLTHMVTENGSSRHGPNDLSSVFSCIGNNRHNYTHIYTHSSPASLVYTAPL